MLNNKNGGLPQDTHQIFFTIFFLLELVVLGIKGKKQNISFLKKFTKYGRWKLHSFETEIDVKACNVSYTIVFKIVKSKYLKYKHAFSN